MSNAGRQCPAVMSCIILHAGEAAQGASIWRALLLYYSCPPNQCQGTGANRHSGALNSAMQRKSQPDSPLIVIVGMPGCGKSLVSQYLRQKGWQVVHFGGITMRELEKRGLARTEANERGIREELRETHGMDAFAKLSLHEIEESLSAAPTLIDGLYSWSEYKYLRRRFGERMKVVAVYTTRSIRYERLSRRPDRPLSTQEAESRDFAEVENLEKAGPIAMADYTIVNDGSEQDLFRAVDGLLEAE